MSITSGQIFGKLTAISRQDKTLQGYLWLCKCICGKEKKVRAASLTSGNTRSCGCIRSELLIKKNTTHNLSKNPAYSNWKDMFKRCKEKYKRRASYFDRGIKVDSSFYDFEVFLKEIGDKPNTAKRWSVGRIDNNKSYEPKNIRWELDEQQARNHTKQANNKTGVVGVHLIVKVISGKCYESFVATYKSLDGKSVTKTFSTNKYGTEAAKNLAIQFRNLGMDSLQKQGAGYASSHGDDK